MKIGIIGAGVIGITTAIELQRRGFEVDLFDRDEPGAGASSGNSGIIATSEVIPFNRPATLRALPAMLLDRGGPLSIRWRESLPLFPWFARFALASLPRASSRSSEALAAMLKGADIAWRRIVAHTDAENLLQARGWLKIHSSVSSFAAGRALAARQANYGVASHFLTGSEARELEPALAEGIAGAVFYPDVLSLRSPMRVVQAIARRFVADGGCILRNDITALGQTDVSAWIETNIGQKRSFDYVVVAAGAWSGPLAAMIGERVSLKTERGYHVMLPTPSRNLTRPVTVSNPGYTMAPMVDGLRIASGIEFASLSSPPDTGRIEAMARHAATILPGLDPTPRSRWLGFRPSMPDSIPVLRRAARIVFAFGHGHLGMTLAPVEAKRVADILDRRHRNRP